MECILHIGTDKTGTTSIQNYFSENRELLLKQGVCYPKTGACFGQENTHFRKDGTRHIGVRFALGDVDIPKKQAGVFKTLGIYDKSSLRAYQERFIKAFDEELQGLKSVHTFVLSDEDIFRNTTPALVNDIYQFLKVRFSSIRVVVYVRDVASYLSSAYCQHVKMGGVLSFDEFVRHFFAQKQVGRFLALWQDRWAEDELVLKPFPSITASNIVNDFSVLCGISGTHDSEHRFNRSLSKTGVSVLLRINRFYKMRRQEKTPRIYRRTLGWLFSSVAHNYLLDAGADVIAVVAAEQEKIDRILS